MDKLSDDEIVAITAAVEKAAAVAGKRRTVSMELFFQLLQLRDDPSNAIPELRSLRDLLCSTERLAKFRNATQHTIGYERTLGSEFLPGSSGEPNRPTRAKRSRTSMTSWAANQSKSKRFWR